MICYRNCKGNNEATLTKCTIRQKVEKEAIKKKKEKKVENVTKTTKQYDLETKDIERYFRR